ncbi:MAG: hypothetical protein AAF502_17195 [Bacteroidota bacterium]
MIKRFVILVAPLLFLFFHPNYQLKAQSSSHTDDICYFIGEISLESASILAFEACLVSGNPAACEIGFAAINCASNPACKGVAKKFVSHGCTYTVEKVGDVIRVSGKALKENLGKLKSTFDALNTAEGLLWLQRYLK